MASKKRPTKRALLVKQAAKYDMVISRRGPFKTHTFRVQHQVLSQFLLEITKRGLILQDEVTHALELWLKQ